MSKRPISDISDDDDKSESESDHSVDNTPEHDQFLGIAYDEHAKPFVRRGPNDKWTLFVISQSSERHDDKRYVKSLEALRNYLIYRLHNITSSDKEAVLGHVKRFPLLTVENWSNFLEHVGRLPNPVHRSSTAASFLNMNIVKEINKCIPEAKTQIQVLELEEQRRKLEETQRNTERQNKLAKVCKTLTHLSETLSNLSK